MKAYKLFYPVLFTALWGCGGSSEPVKNIAVTNSSPAVAADPVGSDRAATPSGEQQAVPDAPLPGSFAERANRVKQVIPTSDAVPPMRFTDADENSQIATSMKSDGAIYEVRVFRGHPQLAKVEATWVGHKKIDLKITLKGGRVANAQTERMESLKQFTSAQLLELARAGSAQMQGPPKGSK